MIDWLFCVSDTLLDVAVTDRLTSENGWVRAFLVLCGIATASFAVWWIGRLMHWW